MAFNSIEFLLFFPIVVILYYAIAQRFRWVLLLASSYYFYMSWKPEYIILIIISTLVDYFAGIRIGEASKQSTKMFFLVLSLVVNLGLLFSFKYFNFFNASAKTFLGWINIPYNFSGLDVLLPVGISFYTFQTLSYTIEVYRGKQKPERHLGIFALYVSFFPQLVAGPIERAQNLLPQFLKKIDFDYDRVVYGLKLMVWGMFKKVMIADRLALLVSQVYGSPQGHKGPAFFIATIFFAFQIYCDFSGYSDIAIGSANVLGIKLMNNFDRPYFAKSIPEFWSRWHISLSTWFRDYLYIPLGGNRCGKGRWGFNIFVTFLLSGLWHGASWTFVIWGALHGFYYLFSRLTVSIRAAICRITGLERLPKVHDAIKIVTTFTLVCFSWIFFRAESLSDALFIISHLTKGWGSVLSKNFITVETLGLNMSDFLLAIGLVFLLLLVQFGQGFTSIRDFIKKQHIVVRWALYLASVLSIMNLGITEKVPFIYFQF